MGEGVGGGRRRGKKPTEEMREWVREWGGERRGKKPTEEMREMGEGVGELAPSCPPLHSAAPPPSVFKHIVTISWNSPSAASQGGAAQGKGAGKERGPAPRPVTGRSGSGPSNRHASEKISRDRRPVTF